MLTPSPGPVHSSNKRNRYIFVNKQNTWAVVRFESDSGTSLSLRSRWHRIRTQGRGSGSGRSRVSRVVIEVMLVSHPDARTREWEWLCSHLASCSESLRSCRCHALVVEVMLASHLHVRTREWEQPWSCLASCHRGCVGVASGHEGEGVGVAVVASRESS